MKRKLAVDVLVLDPRMQCRAGIDPDTLDDYGKIWKNGSAFDSVPDVFFDGEIYWVADGWHRIKSLPRSRQEISVNVHKGSRQDAIVFALGANRTHGLRRTNADKRKAVTVAITEFPRWSDRRVADACGVSHTFVGSVREDVQVSTVDTSTSKNKGKEQKRTGKDGKSYPSSATTVKGASKTLQDKVNSGAIPSELAVELVDLVPSKAKQTALAGMGVRKIKAQIRKEKEKQADPDREKKAARSKLVKTLEAALRAVDDYHELVPNKTRQKTMLSKIGGLLEEVW